MIESESRRDFLFRIPERTAALLAVLSPSLLSSCKEEPKSPERIALEEHAQKEMSKTIWFYEQAQKDPEVPKSAAVTLGQAELQGHDPKKISALFKDISKPYKNQEDFDYSSTANIAYALNTYNISEVDAKHLFEVAISWNDNDSGVASDISALAMAENGDLQKVQEMYNQIASDVSYKDFSRRIYTPDYNAVSTFASAALISDRKTTVDIYKKIKDNAPMQLINAPMQSFANLTLGAIIDNGNVERTISAYKAVSRSASPESSPSYSSITMGALAGIIGLGVDTSIEMYRYARLERKIDTNTSSRLILATAAKKANIPLISREISEEINSSIDVGNVSIDTSKTVYRAVPIILKK
jgi:hypothetical protein